MPWQAAHQDLLQRRSYGRAGIGDMVEVAIDGRWPDFLIIGAQKSGTTWLYRNLAYHPEVWMPLVKELHYFLLRYAPTRSRWELPFLEQQIRVAQNMLPGLSHSRKVLDRHRACLDHLATMACDDDWYRRIFSFAGQGQMVGEASTYYCALPRQVIALLAQRNPRVRVMLLLRDPIDRAWSHIRMQIKSGDALAAALAADYQGQHLGSFVSMSNYREMLNLWRCFIPAEQLLVLNFDDIGARPTEVLRQICRFLHVTDDERFFTRDSGNRIHVGTWRPIPTPLYEALKRSTERIYHDLVAALPEIAATWHARHFSNSEEH